MHRFARAALLLLVNLIALSPVAASGLDAHQPEARLSWRLGFGGPDARLQTGYGLAVDVRAPGFEDNRATLAELDVTGATTLARLAGLPVYARGWQLDQAEGPEAVEGAFGQPAAKPWYARQWVWWTLGGAALTGAVAGGGGGENEQRTCTGICNQNDPDGGRTTVVTGNDDGYYVGCVEGQCAVCPDGSVASTCLTASPALPASAIAPEFQAWLDQGTGHMGDLIAR